MILLDQRFKGARLACPAEFVGFVKSKKLVCCVYEWVDRAELWGESIAT